jgi:outer membrane biosynthesis protein TonB
MPPRQTLDTWTVPELPDDFADRVVTAWEREAHVAVAPEPARRPARSRRWIGIGVGALLGAAAAVALMLLARGPAPAPEGVATHRTTRQPVAPSPRPPEPEAPAIAAPAPTPPEPKPEPEPEPKPEPKPELAPAPEAAPPANAPPTKPAAKVSILRLGTERGLGPATVSVDGETIGTTPISSLKVTAGKHRVTWRWSDGSEQTKVVSVAAGEALTVKAEL